jgi:hypothetical protein
MACHDDLMARLTFRPILAALGLSVLGAAACGTLAPSSGVDPAATLVPTPRTAYAQQLLAVAPSLSARARYLDRDGQLLCDYLSENHTDSQVATYVVGRFETTADLAPDILRITRAHLCPPPPSPTDASVLG